MPIITVIPIDNICIIDGVTKHIIGAKYPYGCRAIQWNGESGVIEMYEKDDIKIYDPHVMHEYIKRHNFKPVPFWVNGVKYETSYDNSSIPSGASLNEPPYSYKELRRKEYPSIGDQLDMIWHDQRDGTDKWGQAIADIKHRYPKPVDS